MKPILKTTIALILILSFHTGFTQTLTWTGNTNANWNIPGNWSGGVVPNSTYNVIIPANPTRQPFISSANASCKSLTINSGATLTVSGYTLSVSNDINISGKLTMNNQSGIINAYGDVNWESGSTAGFTANTLFYVYGGWKFQTGSNVNLTYGTVVFTGPNTNNILCNSASSAFNNIAINKSSNAILGINTYSNFPLQINGYIDVYNGSTLHVYSSKDLIIKGNIISNGVFQCYDGTVKLAGTSQILRMNTGDYFNNFTFNQSGTVTINNTNTNIVEVKKDVVINSGVFNMQDRIMRVGGNWTNTKGSSAFNAGTGRVIFNGSGHQYVKSSEKFNILEIDKGAALRVDSASYIVICNKYEWKKGSIDVYKGTFTALDLVNNGIYGSYYVNPGGTINLHQDASGWIDLNGKFNFNGGGTINVYGGSGYSYWARGGNAEIYMNGGVLDFKNQGIYIYNPSSYTFTHNITGGTIRTSKGLSCYRTDFTPAGGTFEFYGSTDASIYMAQGSHLYEVKINKISKEGDENYTSEPVYDQRSGEMISEGGKANTITLASNFVATRDLIIEAGNFNLSTYTCNVAGTTRVFGKLIMNNSANDLTTYRMEWDDGSSANVTAGTFHAKYWDFREGTTAKLGTGNTAYVTLSIYHPKSNDAEFGNLVLEPSSKNITDDDNTKTYYPFRVMGNMLIKSGANWDFSNHWIVVGNFTIENGANILFSGDLEVGGALNLYGTLRNNINTVTIQGAFTFPSTGWLRLYNSTFTNNYNSSTTYTNLDGKLTMNNNSLLEFPGTNITIGNTFINEVSGGTLRFGRTLNAPNVNNFKLDHGTVEFISAYPSSVSVYNGNYLNDVVINKTGVSFLVDKNLVIKNDLEINSGVLNASDKTITIGGDWENNAGLSGFNAGTGRVIFNGSGHQYVNSSENFNILEANMKATLCVDNVAHTLTCNKYDWKKGGIDVIKGTFTALDLVQNGIFGSYYVNPDATINLHQDAAGLIDLNGQLNFNGGGNINIYGGSSSSYWPWDGNAEINMNGGVLDFKDQKIYIYNSPSYSFTHNITGGTIRTSKGLSCYRTDFTPAKGTFEFYGSTDASINMVSGSHLYDVKINKSSKEGDESFTGEPVYDQQSGEMISEGGKANTITLASNFVATGKLIIEAGNFNLSTYTCNVAGTTRVFGKLIMNNAANDLTTTYMEWDNGSSANVTAGTFHARTWDFSEGTTAKLGTGNTAYVTSTIYHPTSNDAEFGNLVIEPSSKNITDDDNTKPYYPNRVMGNMLIKSGANWNFINRWIVVGNFTIENGANILFGADLEVGGSLNLAGKLELRNNTTATIQGAFIFPSTGWLTLNNGTFTNNYNSTTYTNLDGKLTMNNNSLLEFPGTNIMIENSFINEVSGGTLRFGRTLNAPNVNNFKLDHGTVEFISAYPNHSVSVYNGNYLNDVVINKTGVSFLVDKNLVIKNNLEINSGSLNTLSNQVTVSGNVTINNGGHLSMGAGGGLAMAASKSVTVKNGGLIEFNGESGTQSKITRNSSGYYALNIESGGKIGAEHTIFEYMNTDGVNIKPGAIVDIDKSFNNCLFRNGQSNGRLLTIENDQTFAVNYAIFPNNSWSGNYNVYKSENSGMVTFGGHSGDFSGGSNEWDPHNRLHWGGEVAGNVALQGVDVVSGQDICFDATSILTVAGGGNTFVVQDGGNVNLIAGHNIRMLEGTSVHSGAYLHAYISNEYCTLPPAMLAAEEDTDAYTETVSEKSSEVFENRINDLFRVYPNPTTGIFTLELNTGNESGSVRIEIFNLLGERILNTEQQTNSHYQLDLSGNKAGVYFIRVNSSGRIDQKKLIKH